MDCDMKLESRNGKPMERIHSGHFMKSIEDQIEDEDDQEVEVDVCGGDGGQPVSGLAGNLDSKVPNDDRPVTFYKFGPERSRSIAIDVSLGRLNRAINLAYNQLTTPKWKDFKGLRLRWKHRVRLNNVIWRTWHMEFVKHIKTVYTFFSIPEEDQHNKLEGHVVEGMYWKRRVEAVKAQYKRWRHLATKVRRRKSDDIGRGYDKDQRDVYVPKPNTSSGSSGRRERSASISVADLEVDDFDNAFTDRLFESLKEPYMFPNPKEMAQAGSSDLIQPGLLPLQPSLEEIMNSLGLFQSLTAHRNDDLLVNYSLPPGAAFSMFDAAADVGGASRCGGTEVREGASASGSRTDAPRPLVPVPSSERLGDSTPPHPSEQTMFDFGGGPSPPGRSAAPSPLPPAPAPPPSRTTLLPNTVATSGTASVRPRLSIAIDRLASRRLLQQQESIQMDNRHLWQPPHYSTADQPPPFVSAAPFAAVHASRPLPSFSDVIGSAASMFGGNVTSQTEKFSYFTSSAFSPTTTGTAASISSSSASPQTPSMQQAVSFYLSPYEPVSSSRSAVVPPRSKAALNRHEQLTFGVSATGTATTEPEFGSPSQPGQFGGSVQQNALNSEANSRSAKRARRTITKCAVGSARRRPAVAPTRTSSHVLSSDVIQQASMVAPAPSIGLLVSNESVAQQSSSETSCGTNQTRPFLRTSPSCSLLVSQSSTPIVACPSAISILPAKEEAVIRSSFEQDLFDRQGPGGTIAPAGPIVVVRQSAQRPSRTPADSTIPSDERKRIQHLYAEQTRRTALKDGFEQLVDLLPNLGGAGAKLTNAVVLAKVFGAEYIRQLRRDMDQQTNEKKQVDKEIGRLNEKLAVLQATLACQRPSGELPLDEASLLKQHLHRFVKERSRRHWKYWLLGKLVEGLFESMAASHDVDLVRDNHLEQFLRKWRAEQCQLTKLRPVASDMLVQLATKTAVLTDPTCLTDYVKQELEKP